MNGHNRPKAENAVAFIVCGLSSVPNQMVRHGGFNETVTINCSRKKASQLPKVRKGKRQGSCLWVYLDRVPFSDCRSLHLSGCVQHLLCNSIADIGEFVHVSCPSVAGLITDFPKPLSKWMARPYFDPGLFAVWVLPFTTVGAGTLDMFSTQPKENHEEADKIVAIVIKSPTYILSDMFDRPFVKKLMAMI